MDTMGLVTVTVNEKWTLTDTKLLMSYVMVRMLMVTLANAGLLKFY